MLQRSVWKIAEMISEAWVKEKKNTKAGAGVPLLKVRFHGRQDSGEAADFVVQKGNWGKGFKNPLEASQQ